MNDAQGKQGRKWVGIGTAMVLASASAYGTLAIFAKLAYAVGLGPEQTLAFRFVAAGAGMTAIAVLAGQSPFRLTRAQFMTLAGMGAIVYTAQSLAYFLALQSLPASLVVLIVYVYPALVVLAGWIFLGRRISAWHWLALIGSFTGIAMLVGGASLRISHALVFAVASPFIYTAYILVTERVTKSVPPMSAAAVIMSGAGLGFIAVAAASHQLALPNSASAWAVGVGIAVIPTMIAITLFLAGLPRVGASRAALLSTWEPVVTVGLAVAVLREQLIPVQALGGLLIVGSVIVMERSARSA